MAEAMEREAERARECTGPRGRPAGLSDVLEAGVVKEGKGIVGRKLERGKDFTQPPGEVLVVKEASSYRAERLDRVALELRVENTGAQPWTRCPPRSVPTRLVHGPRRRRTLEGASTTSHADIRWLPQSPAAEHT